jgi:hypothetical protein
MRSSRPPPARPATTSRPRSRRPSPTATTSRARLCSTVVMPRSTNLRDHDPGRDRDSPARPRPARVGRVPPRRALRGGRRCQGVEVQRAPRHARRRRGHPRARPGKSCAGPGRARHRASRLAGGLAQRRRQGLRGRGRAWKDALCGAGNHRALPTDAPDARPEAERLARRRGHRRCRGRAASDGRRTRGALVRGRGIPSARTGAEGAGRLRSALGGDSARHPPRPASAGSPCPTSSAPLAARRRRRGSHARRAFVARVLAARDDGAVVASGSSATRSAAMAAPPANVRGSGSSHDEKPSARGRGARVTVGAVGASRRRGDAVASTQHWASPSLRRRNSLGASQPAGHAHHTWQGSCVGRAEIS